jgi:hypothetical protein
MPAVFARSVTHAIVFCALLAWGGGNARAADLESRVAALGLVPHKALYDVRLVSTHSGSQIVNISGQMYYQWEQTCEAWISNHRFNMLYEYADTAPMKVSSDFLTYEPLDGQSLSFTSQRKRDNEVAEELRGQALLGAGGAGTAQYTLPAGMHFDLPAGTLLPMGHSVALAEKIRDGQTFFKSTIFDGSDETGPVEVSAVISKPLTAPAALQKASDGGPIDRKLLDSPARKVRLAFFPLQAQDPTSDYEMTMVLHDNGIISDMTIEYDDFTVSQTLIALESVPPACGTKKYNP